MFSLDVLKGSTGKMYLLGVIAILVIVYMIFNTVINKINEDSNVHNATVAAKATADLKQSIEENNKKAEEIVKLKESIQERENLEKKVDEVIKQNNELISKPIEKITQIDNTKTIYIEEKQDIEKSKIIINSIHQAYNKGVTNEANTK